MPYEFQMNSPATKAARNILFIQLSRHTNDSLVNFDQEIILSKIPSDLDNQTVNTELLKSVLKENSKQIV